MLSLGNVEVVYDRVFLAIKGVSLEVPDGCMVALLGANGAGKSTTLKRVENASGSIEVQLKPPAINTEISLTTTICGLGEHGS
jgi:ABC-type branched-subunit amino acid transport system ATPase component